jgi:hypothetical protein
MLFAAPFRVPLAGAAALSVVLLAPARASAQSAPQPARIDDSTLNGIIAGAALGTIGGYLAANVADARCGHDLCNNPTSQTYALGIGVGAGAGIGIGWLIDKLHKGKPPVVVEAPASHEARAVTVAWAQAAPPLEPAPSSPSHDPSWDGAVKGALIGAGAMAGLLAINYARCDAGCEAPAEGPMFAWGLSVGAGSGAAAGWLIDKLHKGKAPVPVAVAIRADKEERGVRVSWKF